MARRLRRLVPPASGRLSGRLSGPASDTPDPLADLFKREAFAEALLQAGRNRRADNLQGQHAMMAALRRFWAQEHHAGDDGEYIVPAGELIEVSFLPAPHSTTTGRKARLRASPSCPPSPRPHG
jgi:hypothetical protein